MTKITSLLVLFFLCFSGIINSQKKTNDSLTNSSHSILDYLDSGFFTEEEKLKAIFDWIAENIEYDTKKLHSFDQNQNEDIRITLTSRKGVCYDYVKLFKELASKVNLKSHIVYGYTKQKDKIDSDIHAWCVAKIDSEWYLFDPTWGAGLIREGRYIQQKDQSFFKVSPQNLIKSHMPFDPQWQFLNFPITHEEFCAKEKIGGKKKMFFNFKDSLKIYEKRSRIDNLIAEKKRIEDNIANDSINKHLISNYLGVVDENIKTYYYNDGARKYNIAINSYKEGIQLFNRFIDYWNNEFLPYKGDEYIVQKLNDIENSFKLSVDSINSIYKLDLEIAPLIIELNNAIILMSKKVDKQKTFLDTYLKTSKKKRKLLFYTGI